VRAAESCSCGAAGNSQPKRLSNHLRLRLRIPRSEIGDTSGEAALKDNQLLCNLHRKNVLSSHSFGTVPPGIACRQQ